MRQRALSLFSKCRQKRSDVRFSRFASSPAFSPFSPRASFSSGTTPRKSQGTETIGTFIAPPELLIGGGTITKIQEVLDRLNVRRPLIVTDNQLVKLGLVSRVCDNIKIPYTIFKDTVEDPTTEVVEKGVQLLKEGGYDAMLAIGGGSPMDTAKAMNLLALGGKMREYKVPFNCTRRALPLIAIPTTAGTGSEVTRFTVITDSETSEKMLICGPSCIPNAAIVDYTLTLSVPFRTTADTGIDTLTHGIEAYVSRKANPLSDTFALATIQNVTKYLRRACWNGKEDHEAREYMMLAATQGGFSFSASSVALVHGMSRPIGASFHVPHGLSNAMLLPLVTKFSLGDQKIIARYADCGRAMGLTGDDSTVVDKFIGELKKLNTELKVPNPKEYGIPKEKYFQIREVMASQALASGSPNNNPVIPSLEQLIGLYEQAYDYRFV